MIYYIICGRSWYNEPQNSHIYYRYFIDPSLRNDNVGFRLTKKLKQ